jgi:hypothetical protein
MIEKFNFYDIYGYVLPGFVLGGLVWMPFGVAFHKWPATDISSAILALMLAYIVGMLIQTLASNLIASTIRDTFGKQRYPSAVLLDHQDGTFVAETKTMIGKLCKSLFKLEVRAGDDLKDLTEEELNSVSRLRNAAFSQARSTLIQNSKKSYVEQFEGLYALMRGISVALAAGCLFYLGWGGSALVKAGSVSEVWKNVLALDGTMVLLLIFLVFTLAFSLPPAAEKKAVAPGGAKPKSNLRVRLLSACLGAVALLSGLLAARWMANVKVSAPIYHPNFLLLVLALGLAAASVRCYGAYKIFAKEFAKSVWLDFSNFNIAPKK